MTLPVGRLVEPAASHGRQTLTADAGTVLGGPAPADQAHTSPYDEQWRCSVCKTWKVIPDLARMCEAKHAAAGT